MKSKIVIAVALLSTLSAASVFAQSAESSSLTREQVRAQTLQAIQSGELQRLQAESDGWIEVRPAASTLTRAEVREKTKRAEASGELNQIAYDGFQTVRQPASSTRTRAEVKAELARALADGQVRDPIDSYSVNPVHHYVSPAQRAKLLAISDRLAASSDTVKVN